MTQATARLKNARISTKASIELANHIRGHTTKNAKEVLHQVINKDKAVPFKRFTDGVGHKKGAMDAGRFPVKASEAFLELIRNAENNAENQGLSTDLVITHLSVNRGTTQRNYGRQRGRTRKATHVDLTVTEQEE
jgi:large subunit ribosomal protein L22